MEITRIDKEKAMSTKVALIDIEVDGMRFRITEEPHGIRINGDERLIIAPSVSNEIILSTTDR